MKRIIVSISTIIALAIPGFAFASTWNVDPDHSNVGFKVRHLMVSNVKGSFDKHTGVVEIDDKDITKSRVDINIDTNSINTNVPKRDEHLRSAEFFDVAKYPTMTFVSKKVVKAGKDKLKVTGDLTLHGVTKQVVLDIEGPTKESKDPWGNLRKGALPPPRSIARISVWSGMLRWKRRRCCGRRDCHYPGNRDDQEVTIPIIR